VSERLRWGVLSTANVGRQHVLPAIRQSRNGELAAIASRDAARASACARQFGIPRAYGSYGELLEDPGVGAVYVPLPVSMHAEWCIRCAEAGKPALCEKPLAANSADAQRMVDAFAARGAPLAEALMYRFHPLTQHVRRMVAEGAVGEVRAIQATFCAKCPGEDNIRLRRETGGGALLDVGSYCVSVMRMLTGEEPERVGALAHVGERSGVDEWLVGTLAFPSGALGSLTCTLRTEFGCCYDVYGTEGRIFVEKGVVPGADSEAMIRRWADYRCEETVVPAANHYLLMVEDFAEAVLRGRPPRFDPQDAVRNLDVIDRLLASAGVPG